MSLSSSPHRLPHNCAILSLSPRVCARESGRRRRRLEQSDDVVTFSSFVTFGVYDGLYLYPRCNQWCRVACCITRYRGSERAFPPRHLRLVGMYPLDTSSGVQVQCARKRCSSWWECTGFFCSEKESAWYRRDLVPPLVPPLELSFILAHIPASTRNLHG
jgi:hypothetical protein